MASGLVLRRIQRPDTWQLRPATCKKSKKLLPTRSRPHMAHCCRQYSSSSVLNNLPRFVTVKCVTFRLVELSGKELSNAVPERPVFVTVDLESHHKVIPIDAELC